MALEPATLNLQFQYRIKKRLDLFAQTHHLILILMTDVAGSNP